MKYEITERDGIGNRTRTFVVVPSGKPAWHGIEVWYDLDFQRARCVACSGPMVAMSATCKHARAVARHIAREARA